MINNFQAFDLRRLMCFGKKCGFLTFNIMLVPKKIKLNITKAFLNETNRTNSLLKWRYKNHTVQLIGVNLDIPICNKVVCVFL